MRRVRSCGRVGLRDCDVDRGADGSGALDDGLDRLCTTLTDASMGAERGESAHVASFRAACYARTILNESRGCVSLRRSSSLQTTGGIPVAKPYCGFGSHSAKLCESRLMGTVPQYTHRRPHPRSCSAVRRLQDFGPIEWSYPAVVSPRPKRRYTMGSLVGDSRESPDLNCGDHRDENGATEYRIIADAPSPYRFRQRIRRQRLLALVEDTVDCVDGIM
mmetsp:Transcript_14872/g.39819  ORF Transcript_14872/g.39819 Transcript_14872/m.39819 type:complete len:219 (+) Transcript_14872:94-750(+)